MYFNGCHKVIQKKNNVHKPCIKPDRHVETKVTFRVNLYISWIINSYVLKCVYAINKACVSVCI